MIENPMVIGEYYKDTEPDIRCPHCDMGWTENRDGGWDNDDYIGIKTYGHPLHGGYCEACIMDASTPARAQAFVAQEVAHDDNLYSHDYTIKCCVLPRILMWCMGANETARNNGGSLDVTSCKYWYQMLLADEDGAEQVEEAVKALYPEEYAEYLCDVEDGWHKEVK